MCETRDLVITWPRWHPLLFEGHMAMDMSGLPAGRKEMVFETSQDGLLEEVGSEARAKLCCEENK